VEFQKHELKPEQLKNTFDISHFPFQTMAEIEPLQGIVGQERAVKALDFGLHIKKPGYNIFITGSTGTGRNSYARSLTERLASKEAAPADWCYLYNMNKPDQPRAVSLPAGKALVFQEDMKGLIDRIQEEIPKTLNSNEYNRAKAAIMQKLQEEQNAKVEELNSISHKMGFDLKQTDKGLITIPLGNDGKPLEEEDFRQLSQEKSQILEERSRELNLIIMEAFKRIRDLDRESQQQVEQLEKEMITKILDQLVGGMKEKYQNHPEILVFLEDVKQDVLLNISEFRNPEERNTLENILFKQERSKGATKKYLVNILVDNSALNGAPVVVETNPTYYNLVGKIEYDSHLGVLTTDFTKIKAGALHRANGGYLILQCKDLFANPYSWNAFKRALKTGKIIIENLTSQFGIIPTSSLKPEPIPLDVKVILIGSYQEYQLLQIFDEDFHKLFKVKADFDSEMERTSEHIYKLVQFISAHKQKEQLQDFSRDALARIVEYSSRLADDQQKLSTRFNDLVEIIYESDNWARREGADLVQERHVQQAIREKNYRSNQYEMKLQEMIERGKILISVKGSQVGQINGLAVLNMGDYSFGKPVRITVNTYVGQKGIINIEREVKMSGMVHDKGVLILSGYLGEKFGQKCPLSFSASICFEQLYSGVDGDSASSAELYALLSSLTGIPIKQGIAVTGSVNQKGEIQPIGGVNQKIEGFFQICKVCGLTGEQGVIIPQQNITNLMLDEEVIETVRAGLFHIYAVSRVEKGIEILTGVPAGQPDSAGSYPDNSVFGRAQQRIIEFHQLAVKRDEKSHEDK